MKRRELLKRTGTLLAAGGVAGCLDEGTNAGDADGGGDGTDEPTQTDGTETQVAMPELQSQSVETDETGCGEANEATVAFDEAAGAVTLQGSIPASDPCHVAVVERAEFDSETGTLTVELSVAEDDSDACTQCLGQVDYTASFEFVNGLPDSVEVSHTSRGETTTVATESR